MVGKEQKVKLARAKRRQVRVRASLVGKKKEERERPRLSVSRSNKYVWVQVIDDKEGKTVAAASSKGLGRVKGKKEQAFEVGKTVAEKAVAAGVKRVVFDRGRYAYQGRVKAVAEGARKGGLVF